jgi:hypothetical protein
MSLTDDLMDMGEQPERARQRTESRLTVVLVLLPWIAWIVTLTALMLVVLRE